MGHITSRGLSGKPGRRCGKRGSRLHLRTGRPEVREETHTMNAKGKVFKYGDNVDTDVIIPARYLNIADPKELATHCNGGHRRGFRQEYAARATSWSRPATSAAAPPVSTHRIVHQGRTASPALSPSSFARIFYRNAINIGLPILECEAAANGIDARRRGRGRLRHRRDHQRYQGRELAGGAAFPPFIQNIIQGGRPAQVAQGERGIIPWNTISLLSRATASARRS